MMILLEQKEEKEEEQEIAEWVKVPVGGRRAFLLFTSR